MQRNEYIVTFEKAPEYNATYELTLEKSCSFSYGNGTCVVVKRNGKLDDVLDTRYDKTICEDFNGWCDRYLQQKFNPDLIPNIEKVAA